MNKTVSIHLGGGHFNIEEPAYDALKKYLDSVKRYFSREEGRDEILADIEARLAELLLERQQAAGQVFTVTDIQAVIQIMGNPEEFDDAEGGLDADLEPGPEPRSKRKRVYRDGENKVLGGVCSGFGHYFGLDPVWFRLAFVLAVLFAGTGFLFYLILWLIIPPARSTAEKLEMRGEAINIDTIQKSIQDELNNLKSKISDLDGKTSKQRDKIGQIIADFGRLILNLVQYTLQFIGRFFGLILIVIGGFLLIGFLSWLIGFGDAVISLSNDAAWGVDTLEILSLLFSSDGLFQLVLFLTGIVVIIPLIQLISSGIRILFKLGKPNPWIGRIAGLITVIGIISLFAIGAFTVRDFKTGMPYTESIPIETDSLETLQLMADFDPALPMELNSDRPVYIDPDVERIFLNQVELTIHPTPAPDNFVEVEYRAHARERREARKRAMQIEYPHRLDGAELAFAPHFILPAGTTWRNQRVKLTLFMKEGQKLYIDESMLEIIYDLPNVHNLYDGDMVDHYWIMTDRGLVCMDCNEYSQQNSDSWE